MAQLSEEFMKMTAHRVLQDLDNSLLTQTFFCKLLKIQSAYLSLLRNKDVWYKIPTWVWYLFSCVANKKIEISSPGRINTHSISMEEIHKECKKRAGKPEDLPSDEERAAAREDRAQKKKSETKDWVDKKHLDQQLEDISNYIFGKVAETLKEKDIDTININLNVTVDDKRKRRFFKR